MSRLLDFAEHFSNLSGLIHRVAELDTAITNCEHMDIGTNKRATGVRSDNQVGVLWLDNQRWLTVVVASWLVDACICFE